MYCKASCKAFSKRNICGSFRSPSTSRRSESVVYRDRDLLDTLLLSILHGLQVGFLEQSGFGDTDASRTRLTNRCRALSAKYSGFGALRSLCCSFIERPPYRRAIPTRARRLTGDAGTGGSCYGRPFTPTVQRGAIVVHSPPFYYALYFEEVHLRTNSCCFPNICEAGGMSALP